MPFFTNELSESFSQAGADVNGKGSYVSPLVIARMRGGYTDEIRLLLKAGADPNIPDDVYSDTVQFFTLFYLGSYDTVYYSATLITLWSCSRLSFAALTRHCICA